MRSRRRQAAIALFALPVGTLAVLVACGGSSTSITPPDASADGAATPATGLGPGSSPGSPDAANGDDAGATDAGVLDGSSDARAPNEAGCPATFAAPTGVCQAGLTCQYDEGTCACEPRCFGVMPVDPPTDGARWTCTPKRTDGCPDEPPTSGAACEKKQQGCSYRIECCSVLYNCTSGHWMPGARLCPL